MPYELVVGNGLGLQASRQDEVLGLQASSQSKPFDVNDASTFGLREDGTPKGMGFFGMLPSKDPRFPEGSFSSELSYDSEVNGKKLFYPILVPTMTREEIDHILSGADPTDAMHNKAIDHALDRIKNKLSPFAGPGEQMPLPDYMKATR